MKVNKMDVITSLNKSLHEVLNELLSELEEEESNRNNDDDLINETDNSIKLIRSLNEIISTLNLIETCNNDNDNCRKRFLQANKYKNYNKLIDELAEVSADRLGEKLIELDNELSYWVICHECEKKKITKLAEECGNEKIVKFLYKC